ncbi:MAG TPA: JAB domain-containing protein [Chloroflexota bacterium]|nr:JAB domain-containing protein [Chloroflexota bacterium]
MMTTRHEIRARAARLGPYDLATIELLALVLDRAPGGADPLLRAAGLLADHGGLDGLILALRQGGAALRPGERCRLLAGLELGRRLDPTHVLADPRITCPDQAETVFRDLIGDREREVFAVLTLNTKNRVIDRQVLYVGTVNKADLRAAEVYAAAVRLHGAAVLVAHTHPSGDPTPSPEDFACTQALVAAGAHLDIAFHDHLILTPARAVSLRRDYPESVRGATEAPRRAAERRLTPYRPRPEGGPR